MTVEHTPLTRAAMVEAALAVTVKVFKAQLGLDLPAELRADIKKVLAEHIVTHEGWQSPADITACFSDSHGLHVHSVATGLGLREGKHFRLATEHTSVDLYSPEAVALIKSELRFVGYTRLEDERPAPNPTKLHTRREG